MLRLARTHQMELLDQLGDHAPVDVLRGNLHDIRRANRWFGGASAVLTTLAPLLRAQDAATPLSVLDVATGSADIPIALADWAMREGRQVRIVATDLQPDVLRVARAAVESTDITVEQADALNL
ncbi:MAG TPA: class I SAM-dependent methyltransferase, partial [Thermomicrobiales bacterium]|nr:class I SAM-dependent methyltransferase [Thermomicrobiales bacterium]